MKPYLYPLVLFFVLTGCKSAQNPERNLTPSFRVSKKTTHKIPDGQKFTFGYLKVPENRKDPNSNTIKLPVYIFKSRNPNPKPDPVLYTVGGPGYTSMRASQYMNAYKYLDDRDFILFEQRGTQYAQPNLACPEWSEAVYLSNLPSFDTTQSDSLFNDAAKRCKEQLVNKGIDLNGYNTNEIAADIEDLRKLLNINKLNLLTISYSTKIAQVMMRDYPNSIRSVVMDSPLPLEVNYDEESVRNTLEVLDRLLSDCERDATCSSAFPNIKERFHAFLIEKTKDPLVIEVDNSNNGDKEIFKLKGEDLIAVFTSSGTNNVPNIPLEINKLLNGDFSSIKEILAYAFEGPGEGNGIGMRLSVWCAEEYPFVSQEKVLKETYRYPEVAGLSPATYKAQVCNIWGVEKVPSIENEPVKSSIPVLFINGSYDELTPVKWADNMEKNLINSYHLVLDGWKHTPTTNWSNPCAMEAANIFFNNPESKPNPDCVKTIKSPKFTTR